MRYFFSWNVMILFSFLHEACLMSTHNICFRGDKRKILSWYPLLAKVMYQDSGFSMKPCGISWSSKSSCYVSGIKQYMAQYMAQLQILWFFQPKKKVNIFLISPQNMLSVSIRSHFVRCLCNYDLVPANLTGLMTLQMWKVSSPVLLTQIVYYFSKTNL